MLRQPEVEKGKIMVNSFPAKDMGTVQQKNPFARQTANHPALYVTHFCSFSHGDSGVRTKTWSWHYQWLKDYQQRIWPPFFTTNYTNETNWLRTTFHLSSIRLISQIRCWYTLNLSSVFYNELNELDELAAHDIPPVINSFNSSNSLLIYS